MSHTLPTGRCSVDWCDQRDRPHTEHELTVGTWPGTSHASPRRAIVAQLVVGGYTTEEAAPIIALIDNLEQTDVLLTWDQLRQIAAEAAELIVRFGSRE